MDRRLLFQVSLEGQPVGSGDFWDDLLFGLAVCAGFVVLCVVVLGA